MADRGRAAGGSFTTVAKTNSCPDHKEMVSFSKALSHQEHSDTALPAGVTAQMVGL